MKLKNAFKIGISALAISTSIPQDASSYLRLGNYSEGCRYGELSKCSLKGLVIPSLECELLLGNGSSPKKICETVENVHGEKSEECIQINPWGFSIPDPKKNQSLVKSTQGLTGQKVVACYTNDLMSSSVGQDTNYTLTSIDNSSNKYPEWAIKGFAIKLKDKGHQSDGERYGRIVKMSIRGAINKSYEVTIQVGSEGTNFMDMTITDEEMYKKAIEAMRSGLPYVIGYNQLYLVNGLVRDTDYTIVSLKASNETVPNKGSTDCNDPKNNNDLAFCLKIMQEKLNKNK